MNRPAPNTSQFRLLTAADTASLHCLRETALREHPRAFRASPSDQPHHVLKVSETLLEQTEHGFIVGAFVSGKLAGILGLTRQVAAKCRHRADLWGAYVSPRLRQHGIGSGLMQTLLAEAKRRPAYQQILASVYSESSAARKLLLRSGFCAWGIARRAARVGNDYLDEEHFVLELRDHATAANGEQTR